MAQDLGVLQCFPVGCRCIGLTCKPFPPPLPAYRLPGLHPECCKNQCLIGLIHPWKGRSPGEGAWSRQVFCLLCQAREDKPVFVLIVGGDHAKWAASKTCPWYAPDLNKASQPLDLKCGEKGNKTAVEGYVELCRGILRAERESELFWVLVIKMPALMRTD